MDYAGLVLLLCFFCSYQQIQVLDKMMVERMSAERSECVQRVEQQVMKERLETERRQVQAARAHLASTWSRSAAVGDLQVFSCVSML